MTPSKRFILLITLVGFALFAWSLRFSAPEFRAWEVLKKKDGLTFEPSRQLEMEEIGDLGYKTWVRALQHRHTTRFTTDRWGFRNPVDLEEAEIVVLGDSYTVGSGLSDDETVPQRLSAKLGTTVYNYGLETGATPALFLADERFKRTPPKWVIYSPVGRLIRPRPILLPGGKWPAPKRPGGVLDRWVALGSEVQSLNTGLNRDNGLAVDARYALNGLRYDLWGVPQTLEIDGQKVLVLSIEDQYLHLPPEVRQVRVVVQMLVALEHELGRRGMRFLFAPVPEVGMVYADHYPPEAQAKIYRPTFLDVLFAGLTEAGVPFVDLRVTLAANRFPYLYQPDDSHWNARATALAADAIAQALRASP